MKALFSGPLALVTLLLGACSISDPPPRYPYPYPPYGPQPQQPDPNNPPTGYYDGNTGPVPDNVAPSVPDPADPYRPPGSDALAQPSAPLDPAPTLSQPSGPQEYPFGIPVPGKDGLVYSPYSKDQGYVDVRGLRAGDLVEDPYKPGQFFKVP
ncbi:MAG: hypothetical protein AAF555_03630 [Verrucomicrobiota bacterium]